MVLFFQSVKGWAIKKDNRQNEVGGTSRSQEVYRSSGRENPNPQDSVKKTVKRFKRSLEKQKEDIERGGGEKGSGLGGRKLCYRNGWRGGGASRARKGSTAQKGSHNQGGLLKDYLGLEKGGRDPGFKVGARSRGGPRVRKVRDNRKHEKKKGQQGHLTGTR